MGSACDGGIATPGPSVASQAALAVLFAVSWMGHSGLAMTATASLVGLVPAPPLGPCASLFPVYLWAIRGRLALNGTVAYPLVKLWVSVPLCTVGFTSSAPNFSATVMAA